MQVRSVPEADVVTDQLLQRKSPCEQLTIYGYQTDHIAISFFEIVCCRRAGADKIEHHFLIL